MNIARSSTLFNSVDYYPLPNGFVDVFMHKNMRIEEDIEGNAIHIADEVYFQIDSSITKEYIENNFEYMWNDAENSIAEPTDKEKIANLETLVLELMGVV